MSATAANLWPVRAFAVALSPLACWQVWLFPAAPNYYAQHFFIYPCLLFMAWAWLRGLWSLDEAWKLARPFLPWLVLLFALQAAASWQSAQSLAPEGASLARIFKGLLKLGVQLPFLLFLALLCRVLLRDAKARHGLLLGAGLTFAALVLWCGVQAFYVYTVPSIDWFYVPGLAPEPGLAPWREAARQLLLWPGPWLEARWKGAVYDFYSQGAYALTMARFNGFFEEASALAAMLGVFFLPLGFGLLGLRSCFRRAGLAGWAVIALALALLLLCRSSTGQILAAATLLFLLARAVGTRILARRLPRPVLLGLLALLLGGSLYAAFHAPLLSATRSQHAGLASVSKSPRMVTTVDTLDMVRAYPLLGVGRDWYFAHLHQGRRYLAHLDNIELRMWKKQGSGGELAALPALASQYGLPLLAVALIFVGRVWWRLQRLRRAAPSCCALRWAAPACTAWLALGFVTAWASLDVRNPLFCLPFFCFYALSQGIGVPGPEEESA